MLFIKERKAVIKQSSNHRVEQIIVKHRSWQTCLGIEHGPCFACTNWFTYIIGWPSLPLLREIRSFATDRKPAKDRSLSIFSPPMCGWRLLRNYSWLPLFLVNNMIIWESSLDLPINIISYRQASHLITSKENNAKKMQMGYTGWIGLTHIGCGLGISDSLINRLDTD